MQKLYEITVGQKHKNLYKLKKQMEILGPKSGTCWGGRRCLVALNMLHKEDLEDQDVQQASHTHQLHSLCYTERHWYWWGICKLSIMNYLTSIESHFAPL